MKTLKAGTKQSSSHVWWDGLEVKCADCGASFELEARDNVTEHRHTNATSEYFVYCPTAGCQARIAVEKPE